MTLITYEQIAITGIKYGKCLCGKYRRRKEEFSETISPWNKKTKSHIMKELIQERKKWTKEQITCDKCK